MSESGRGRGRSPQQYRGRGTSQERVSHGNANAQNREQNQRGQWQRGARGHADQGGRGSPRGRGRVSPNAQAPTYRSSQSLEEQFSGLDIQDKEQPQKSQKEIREGHRPSYGESNDNAKVIANYVKISKLPVAIFQYKLKFWKVSIEGPMAEITVQRQKLHVIQNLEADFFDTKCWVASTDVDLLWTTTELPTREGKANVPEISHTALNGATMKVQMIVEFDKKIQQIDSSSGIVSMTPHPELQFHKLTILNAFFSKPANRNGTLTRVGANRFFMNNKSVRHISHGPLEIRCGFTLSTRATKGGLALNVNTATTLFLKETGLSDVMENYGHRTAAEWTGLLKGVRVQRINSGTTREVAKVKIIHGFGLKVKDQEFTVGKEKRTVLNHFQKVRHETIRKPYLFCVNVGSVGSGDLRSPEWVPPEFLRILKNQPAPRKWSEKFVSDIITHAARRPDVNRQMIATDGLEQLGLWENYQGETNLKNCGFEVEGMLMAVDAHFLKAPEVRYRGNDREIPQYASWNLRNKRFCGASPIPNIGILVIKEDGDQPNQQSLANIRTKFEQYLQAHGCTFNRDSTFTTNSFNRSEVDVPKLELIFRGAKEQKNKLVLVVLPDIETTLYENVKFAGDVRVGIPTVCMSGKKLYNFSPQYISNVAMKINFKLGGWNHTVDWSRVAGMDRPRGGKPGLDMNSLIVMGADVIHLGSSGQKGCPSVASVLGSVDGQMSTYLASMRAQNSLQERIADMTAMVKERLEAWARRNTNKTAKNLLFYRDGVGESQYEEIKCKEIPAIRQAWTSVFGNKPLNLTFVLVSKRHQTRFFPQPNQQHLTTNSGNLKPGLVVDRAITHPDYFDFYMQPHDAIKGTARPPHYYVLCNELELTANELQGISLALCYCHARATKGISAPAPVYAADLCCQRAKAYIRWPDARIEGKGPNESDEDYLKRCLEQFKESQQHWKKRIGPWDEALHGIMFYL